jgi:hypothetical protein
MELVLMLVQLGGLVFLGWGAYLSTTREKDIKPD